MEFPALSGIQAIQLGSPPSLSELGTLRGITQGSAPSQVDMLRGAGQAMGLRVDDDVPFESLLQAYLSMVNNAGLMESHAQNLQIDYALGKHDDMLSVILAQEMAFTSLHFTVQVTNRVIEAYREIMRMQI